MNGDEDRPARVLVLVVPACEPERTRLERTRPEHSRPGRTDPGRTAPTPEQRMRVEQTWAAVLTAVQRTVPGAVQLQQGCCAMRARGPTRYYGGEAAAARAVLDCVSELLRDEFGEGVAVGIASSRFAAEQAARVSVPTAQASEQTAQASEQATALRLPSPGVRLVEEARTAEFLSGLPIACAADDALAPVLTGLGVRTLGAFAALPEQAVLQRFGQAALLAHRRARGLGELHGAEVSGGGALHDLSVSFEFEPPLEGLDQLAFACSGHAERFVRQLGERALVCTELRVELLDDTANSHQRNWSHPANFTAADVVNRVRWQAASLPKDPERGGAGIAAVKIAPARTAPAAAHEPGLWNDAPADRVHHQLTRVQSLLGPEGVGTGLLTGGRISTERQRLIPWGAKRESPGGAGPWPGRLQGPLPTLVAAQPAPARLLDAHGEAIVIDEDELLGGTPSRFMLEGAPPQAVRSWSAPWPLREQWWEPDRAEPAVYRLQLVLDDGEAWLLRYARASGWAAEGRYT